MKKVLFILTIIIFFNCNTTSEKQKKEHQKAEVNVSKDQINFDRYIFNTIEDTKEKISLEKDKKYILDFWYLECAPCIQQHQEIKKHQAKLAENNIEVIGISIDMSKKRWKEYLEEHPKNWLNYNQYFEEYDLKDDLEIKLFPAYYFINGEGVIIEKFNSFQKVITYLKL